MPLKSIDMVLVVRLSMTGLTSRQSSIRNHHIFHKKDKRPLQDTYVEEGQKR